MEQSPLLPLVAASAGLGLLVGWFLLKDKLEDVATQGAAAPVPTESAPSREVRAAPVPPVPAPPRTTPPRTTVPRPATPAAAARRVVQVPAAAPAAPTGQDDEADAEGPVDKRGEGGDPQVLEDIRTGMDMVTEDIQACIEDWEELAPGMDGKVNVGFRLGPEGLQEAWIVDHQDVPAGPLTCFSAAIYEVDWADISDEPLEVTFPFVVTTE